MGSSDYQPGIQKLCYWPQLYVIRLQVFGAGETEGKGKADLDDVVPFSSTGRGINPYIMVTRVRLKSVYMYVCAYAREDILSYTCYFYLSPNSAPDLDLAAIPRTVPSLGRRPGHTRRDLVARSSVKRRPASHRAALLLQVRWLNY